jgi:hypothetical protein
MFGIDQKKDAVEFFTDGKHIIIKKYEPFVHFAEAVMLLPHSKAVISVDLAEKS